MRLIRLFVLLVFLASAFYVAWSTSGRSTRRFPRFGQTGVVNMTRRASAVVASEVSEAFKRGTRTSFTCSHDSAGSDPGLQQSASETSVSIDMVNVTNETDLVMPIILPVYDKNPGQILNHLESCCIPRIIWLYRDQGEPDNQVMKRAWTSWSQMNPTWETRALEAQTLSRWLNKQEIDDTLRVTSTQARSDLVRIALLERYGGVYADSDVYCLLSLDTWLVEAVSHGDFFTFSLIGRDRPVVSWFIASLPGNLITTLWKQAIFEHARLHDRFERYFQLHYEFRELIKRDSAFQRAWSQTPKVNATLGADDGCCVPLLREENTLPRVPVRQLDGGFLGELTVEFETMVSSRLLPVIKGTWKKELKPPASVSFLDYLDNKSYAEIRKPFIINIGMPKTGTSSLSTFLNQQGFRCAQWQVGDTKIGNEMELSIRSGRQLFGDYLSDFNCITQLDCCDWVSQAENLSKCIWPQHDLLSELVSRYPAAKYVYTTRNTTTWFDSVSRWGDFLDRIRFSNTPGLQYGASDADIKKWYEAKQETAQRFFQQTGKENRLVMLPLEKSQIMASDLLDFLFEGNIEKAKVTREYPRDNRNSPPETDRARATVVRGT